MNCFKIAQIIKLNILFKFFVINKFKFIKILCLKTFVWIEFGFFRINRSIWLILKWDLIFVLVLFVEVKLDHPN
jgi:hypothetical protein